MWLITSDIMGDFSAHSSEKWLRQHAYMCSVLCSISSPLRGVPASTWGFPLPTIQTAFHQSFIYPHGVRENDGYEQIYHVVSKVIVNKSRRPQEDEFTFESGSPQGFFLKSKSRELNLHNGFCKAAF